MHIGEAEFGPDTAAKRPFHEVARLFQSEPAWLVYSFEYSAACKRLSGNAVEQCREGLAPPNKRVIRIHRSFKVRRRDHLARPAKPPCVPRRVDRQRNSRQRAIVNGSSAATLTLHETRDVLGGIMLVDERDIRIIVPNLKG